MAVTQFLDVRINDLMQQSAADFGISYSSSWAMSSWNTFIAEQHSGIESRNINWADAKGAGNLVFGTRSLTEIQSCIDLHTNTRGMGIGFRFKDPLDYSVVGGSIGTGNGANPLFYLVKVYSVANGNPYNRPIKKPVNGTVNIYVNGVLQTETTDYSIDYSTGLVTFLTAPANTLPVTADFEYDIPLRFDNDKFTVTHDSFGSVTASISISEDLTA